MRSPSQTAVRALAWGVLFFAGMQLLLNLTLDYWRVELRDPEYAVKLADLRARIAERPGSPVVLMLGSSRPAYGFRPDASPPLPLPDGRVPVVFNGAFLGAGPELELLCLHRLLADGVRPDLVIIECWPPAWYQQGDQAEDVRIEIERLSCGDVCLLRNYAARPADLCWRWCERRLVPWYSSRCVLLTRTVPGLLQPRRRRSFNWVVEDATGWRPCPWHFTPQQERDYTAKGLAAYRPILADFHPGEGSRRALEDLLAVCRREEIRALLVFLPEPGDFRASYPPPVDSQLKSYLEGLSLAYEVPYVDARDWVADADFIDSVHLRPRGARRFSERFGREVLQPLLTGRN